jgi:hypothetical protein
MLYTKCAAMAVKTDVRTLHSLLFADDQIVFAEECEDMEHMVWKIKEEYE